MSIDGVPEYGEPSDFYRFGLEGVGWLGARHDRMFTSYKAASVGEAWEVGRQAWLSRGISSLETLVSLERLYLFPQTVLLEGAHLHRADLEPRRRVWVRLVLGYADTAWLKS